MAGDVKEEQSSSGEEQECTEGICVWRTGKLLTYLSQVPGCAQDFAGFEANGCSLLISHLLGRLQCRDGAVRGPLPRRSSWLSRGLSSPSPCIPTGRIPGWKGNWVSRRERKGHPGVWGEMTWLQGVSGFGNIFGNFLFLPNQDFRSQKKK